MARALVSGTMLAFLCNGGLSQSARWTTEECWVATPGTFAPIITAGVSNDLSRAQRGCGLMSACNAVTCRTNADGTPEAGSCTPRAGPGLMLSSSGEITFEQVCRVGQPLPQQNCWSGSARVFPQRYVIPYAVNLTSGAEDRAKYSLRDALPRCLQLQGGCGAVACDSRPRILPPFPNRDAQCTVRRSATSENTVEPAPACKPVSTSTEDDGYVDGFRGWYDVQGCGRCLDYCRWVGNSGPGGDPAVSLENRTSWWSCRLAGSSEPYTLRGSFSSWPHSRCSEQNAVSDAIHESTFEATYVYSCGVRLI